MNGVNTMHKKGQKNCPQREVAGPRSDHYGGGGYVDECMRKEGGG